MSRDRFRSSLSLLILAVGIYTDAHAQEDQSNDRLPEKRVALLIGIDKYDDDQIGELTDPSNDIEDLQSALITNAGFLAPYVIVLSNQKNATHQPTRANILRELAALAAKVPPDGNALLLVMFVGHGTSRGEESYLLPKDAIDYQPVVDPSDPSSAARRDLTANTSLPVTLFKDYLAHTSAKHTILFMDACRKSNTPNVHGGSHADEHLSATLINRFTNGLNQNFKSSMVVFGTGLDGVTIVDSATKRGYASELFVAALKGARSAPNGDVSLLDLKNYIEDELPLRVQQDLGRDVVKPDIEIRGVLAERMVISNKNGTFVRTGAATPPSGTATPSTTPLPPVITNPSPLALDAHGLADSVRWYTKRHFDPDEDDKNNRTQQSLWLDLPPELRNQITRVTYDLHDKSFRPMSQVPDNSTSLQVFFTAWGCVDSGTVTAELRNGGLIVAPFNECKELQQDSPSPN